MSGISTAHSTIVTRLGSVLTGYTRIPNPYQVEFNPEPLLKKGYGVKVGPAINTNLQIADLTLGRDFTVVLSRKVDAHEHDAAARGTAEKSLMEDLLLVIKDLVTNSGLNGDSVVTSTNYQGDSGISFVGEGIIYTEAEFRVDYFESYT